MTEPLPFKEQLIALVHLQELDLNIDNLKRKKTALPGQLKEVQANYNRLKEMMEVKTSVIDEQQKVQRQILAAIELNDDRLKRTNERLTDIKNTKEFQAINKEISQLQELNASLATQKENNSKGLEASQTELVELKTQFENIQAQRDSQAAELSKEVVMLDTNLSRLEKERQKFTINIDRRVLSTYERVRVRRGGLGLVPTEGGRCKGCNMHIPPQLYNQVQKNLELVMCPNCNRFLFIPQPPTTVATSTNDGHDTVAH